MKIKAKLLIVSSIVCILLIQVPTEGQGSFLYSVRAQKDLPNHNLSDFSDAKSIILNSELNIRELYVKNSENELFLGFRVQQNLIANSTLEGVAVIFDVDHDRIYADDVKILYLNETKEDGYFYQNSALSLQGNNYFSGSVHQVTYIDGKSYELFEYSIPFNPNSNPTTDMYIPDPSDYMLGFDFVEIRNNSLVSWTRGDLIGDESIKQLNSSSNSFYTMILAGPGKYAVPDFNPVVTTSTQATSSAATYGQSDKAYTTSSYGAGASPGFELLFVIPTFAILIIVRKAISRRLKK